MASKKETAAPKTLPSHGVFVVEGEGDRAYWTKIGAAWPHQDGDGFNVTLSAVPLSGRIVIRARKDKEAGE
jgi:hypothetical protein